jgi:hypothetical protein
MKKTPSRRGTTAKRTRTRPAANDEILPEYDFSKARRNPYAARFAAGVTLVALDADVAAAFPDAAAVNEALRALAKIAQRTPKRAASKRRTA